MRSPRRSPGAQCRLPYPTERYRNEWAKATLGSAMNRVSLLQRNLVLEPGLSLQVVKTDFLSSPDSQCRTRNLM